MLGEACMDATLVPHIGLRKVQQHFVRSLEASATALQGPRDKLMAARLADHDVQVEVLFEVFWRVTPSSCTAPTLGVPSHLRWSWLGTGAVYWVTRAYWHISLIVSCCAACTEPSSTQPPTLLHTPNVMSSTNVHLSGASRATPFAMTKNTSGPNWIPCGTPHHASWQSSTRAFKATQVLWAHPGNSCYGVQSARLFQSLMS